MSQVMTQTEALRSLECGGKGGEQHRVSHQSKTSTVMALQPGQKSSQETAIFTYF